MISSRHPLWLVGFRPFFALACLAGLSLPLLWILILKGVLPAPSSHFSATQWHAHEMFYGFGWAVLGGFLLTSTKNWVSIRGYHGPILMWLAAAWIFERLSMAFGSHWSLAIFQFSNHAFLLSMVALLGWTLIRHRQRDTYRDNAIFLVILPLFIVAKILILSPEHFSLGWQMTISLFRVAFLVMLERTLTPFMRGAFKVEILRQPLLDNPIKLLAVLLIAGPFLPVVLTQSLGLLLALLLLGRLFFWHPFQAMQRIEIGVMYLGYLAIVGQLLIDVLPPPGTNGWVGTVSVHVFTFGAMGLIIPAMIVRIANGHTGRKVVFSWLDKSVLWIMMLAFFVRLIGPQLLPALYLRWLDMAATCWLLAFGLLAWRYIPFLLQKRIDGKEH